MTIHNHYHSSYGFILFTAITSISILSNVTGCSEPQEFSESMSNEVAQDSQAFTAIDENAAGTLQVTNLSGGSEQTLGSPVADTNVIGKDLVITARAKFEVDDVVETTSTIEGLTRDYSGYVALSDISNNQMYSRTFTQADEDITLTTYHRHALMTVRIPRDSVNDFMSEVQHQVKFLQYQEFKAEDVTLDIYREKLEQQLNSNMANELSDERLDSNDAEEQGSNVDSIIATYDANRREQLARLQQMEINDRVKYSTIDLEFSQPNIVFEEVSPNIDSVIRDYEPSFFSQVGESMTQGWNTLKKALITLIGLWWLIPVLFLLYMLFKLFKVIYRYTFKKISALNNNNKY